MPSDDELADLIVVLLARSSPSPAFPHCRARRLGLGAAPKPGALARSIVLWHTAAESGRKGIGAGLAASKAARRSEGVVVTRFVYFTRSWLRAATLIEATRR
jgi:hypothetical protein